MIGWFLGLRAVAAPSADDVMRQQELVDQAALAVAHARSVGARAGDIAELMASYRTQAELLSSMSSAPPDPTTEEARRQAALAALADATARGRTDGEARSVIDGWLGPLDSRLDVLDGALAAAAGVRSAELRATMVVDVLSQCTAVLVASAHDAQAADRDRQQTELRASALKLQSPGVSTGIDTEVDLRALEVHAADAAERARLLWLTHDRATALCGRARAPLPEPSP